MNYNPETLLSREEFISHAIRMNEAREQRACDQYEGYSLEPYFCLRTPAGLVYELDYDEGVVRFADTGEPIQDQVRLDQINRQLARMGASERVFCKHFKIVALLSEHYIATGQRQEVAGFLRKKPLPAWYGSGQSLEDVNARVRSRQETIAPIGGR